MEIAIIGGGAAGFFLAVNLKTFAPQVEVTVFERQADVLKKVLVSGGGRCNLTNTFEGVTDLKQVYPRGHKLLKGLFKQFGHRDACRWFEAHGVPLVAQDDHCVFPAAQDARAVAGCLKSLAAELGVTVKTSHRVETLTPCGGKYSTAWPSPPAVHRVAKASLIWNGWGIVSKRPSLRSLRSTSPPQHCAG